LSTQAAADALIQFMRDRFMVGHGQCLEAGTSK
jgi:hypothetical protein